MRRALIQLRDKTDATFAEVQNSFTNQIDSRSQACQPAVSEPRQHIRSSNPELAKLSSRYANLAAEVEALANRPAPDTALLRAKIHKLQQQVSKLQQQNQEIVKPLLTRLSRAVKQLRTTRILNNEAKSGTSGSRTGSSTARIDKDWHGFGTDLARIDRD